MSHHDHDDHSHEQHLPQTFTSVSNHHQLQYGPGHLRPAEVYGYGTLAIVLISIVPLIGALIVPLIRKKAYDYSMLFFMAMAVGTLASDALLHLLPMALKLHNHSHHEAQSRQLNNATNLFVAAHASHESGKRDAHEHGSGDEMDYMWKCTAVLGAIYVLYLFEWFAHTFGSKHGHVHSHHPLNESHQKLARATDDARFTSFAAPPKSLASYGSTNSFVAPPAGAIISHGNQHRIVTNGVGIAPLPDAVMAAWKDGGEDKPIPALNFDDDAFPALEAGEARKPKSENDYNWVTCGLKPVAFMILLGDALHNFADGLAVGAAFSASPSMGFSTTIAVFCHEVPHELGDFAVFIASGISVRKAMLLNLVSSVFALIGLYAGIALAGDPNVRHWVFAVVAGVFLYVALVDMMQELRQGSEMRPLYSFLLQNSGILFGFTILLLIAIYEDQIVI